MTSIPMVLAGLMGASGVVLAALAAHAQPGAGLDSAAQMLLFHALAVVGSSALAESGRLWRTAALVAMAGWLLGGTLFSGDAIYDGPLLDELDHSDIADYCATMQRLMELPVTVVHAGHDPSFGRDRLREISSDYLARRS